MVPARHQVPAPSAATAIFRCCIAAHAAWVFLLEPLHQLDLVVLYLPVCT